MRENKLSILDYLEKEQRKRNGKPRLAPELAPALPKSQPTEKYKWRPSLQEEFDPIKSEVKEKNTMAALPTQDVDEARYRKSRDAFHSSLKPKKKEGSQPSLFDVYGKKDYSKVEGKSFYRENENKSIIKSDSAIDGATKEKDSFISPFSMSLKDGFNDVPNQKSPNTLKDGFNNITTAETIKKEKDLKNAYMPKKFRWSTPHETPTSPSVIYDDEYVKSGKYYSPMVQEREILKIKHSIDTATSKQEKERYIEEYQNAHIALARKEDKNSPVYTTNGALYSDEKPVMVSSKNYVSEHLPLDVRVEKLRFMAENAENEEHYNAYITELNEAYKDKEFLYNKLKTKEKTDRIDRIIGKEGADKFVDKYVKRSGKDFDRMPHMVTFDENGQETWRAGFNEEWARRRGFQRYKDHVNIGGNVIGAFDLFADLAPDAISNHIENQNHPTYKMFDDQYARAGADLKHFNFYDDDNAPGASYKQISTDGTRNWGKIYPGLSNAQIKLELEKEVTRLKSARDFYKKNTSPDKNEEWYRIFENLQKVNNMPEDPEDYLESGQIFVDASGAIAKLGTPPLAIVDQVYKLLESSNGAAFQKAVEGGSTEEILKAFCGVATEEAMQTGAIEASKWVIAEWANKYGVSKKVTAMFVDVANEIYEYIVREDKDGLKITEKSKN